ncbi:hypothetical protein ACI2TU_04555 [Ralstonia nicotianae]
MLLFFEFDRLLRGHHIGERGPAARLARVLDEFPTVELVMIRWAIGPIRGMEDVQGELPELGNRVRHLSHRSVRSEVFHEREITSTLRRLKQIYWAAVVHERQAGGYLRTAQSSGAPLVLCRNGFDDEAACRLRVALERVVSAEAFVSADHGFSNPKEFSCAS